MLKKVILGLIAVTLVVTAYFTVNKVQKVGDLVDPLTYFDEFKRNTNNLVYKDERINLVEPIMVIENDIYVSYQFANAYVSDIIFYDSAEKVMTLTNAREVVRLYPGKENDIEFNGIKGRYSLEERNDELAEEIKSNMFIFDDIVRLENIAIQGILKEINVKDIAFALKGASKEVAETIFKNQSQRASQALREEIDLLGKVKISQVEEAQQNIVNTIRRLEDMGEINLTRGSDDEFIM